METKDGVAFAQVDPMFRPPRIKRALNGCVPCDLLDDCKVIAPIPGTAEPGDRINFHLYTPLGEFFSSPMVITQDLLEEREVCWHMLCWDYSLAPGSWVRLKYVIQIQNNDLYDSPLREYAVVT